jgi:tetratricopeptide (TPR) repeat protein
MAKRRKPEEPKSGVRLESTRKPKTSSSRGKSSVKSPERHGRTAAGIAGRVDSPLERAQELAWKAMQSHDAERQLELAEKALQLSEDCTDAYTVLARFVADGRQALELLEQGLAAAQRVLGLQLASIPIDDCWVVNEIRPYLRVRLGLSECLWSLGRPEEANAQLQDILRLNPGDNQGVRYLLAAHLLELGCDDEFDRLDEKYNEPSAFLMFSKVLREFRRSGDSPAARKQLAQARRINKFIVPLLLDLAPADDQLPDTYSPGDNDEALLYIADFAGGWKHTPGAVTWLRTAVEQPQSKAAKPAVGPTAAVKKQLAGLPQSYGTIWQATVSRVPTWLREGGRMVRPWSILIVNHTDHLIIGQELAVEEPGSDVLFDRLAHAMRKPAAGKRHRPSEIQVRDEAVWEAVQPHLQEIGVDCIIRSELEEADFILAEMQKMMLPDGQPPAMVEMSTFNSSQGASFYAAAGAYYRSAPWRRVPADSLIQIDCPQLAEFSSGHWYAVVLGQAGKTLGLALYSDKSAIEKICCGGGCSTEPEEFPGGDGASAISMLFSEAFELPIADTLAAEQHHWELAGPEAYPLILCAEGGSEVRPIAPFEFQLLEGCVRAIPDFVRQHPYSSESSTSESSTNGSSTNGSSTNGSSTNGEGPSKPVSAPFAVVSSNLKFTLSWVEPDAGSCGGDCESCEN